MQVSRTSRRAALCAISTALLLGGCASPYGKNVLFGGFTEEKVADNSYRIRYSGNGYTGEDQVVKYWLYRAAELTRENGYEYFGVRTASSLSQQEDSPFVKTRGGGGAPIFIYTPGYTIHTWSKDGYITMYHTRLASLTPEQANALHAQTVLAMLKPYVESGGKVEGPSRREVIEAAARAGVVPTFTIPVPRDGKL